MNSGGYSIRLQKAFRLVGPPPPPHVSHSCPCYKNTKTIIISKRAGYSQHVSTYSTKLWNAPGITRWKTFVIMSNNKYELSRADRPTMSTHTLFHFRWVITYICVNMFSIFFPSVRWERLGNQERGSVRHVGLQRSWPLLLCCLPCATLLYLESILHEQTLGKTWWCWYDNVNNSKKDLLSSKCHVKLVPTEKSAGQNSWLVITDPVYTWF